MRPPRHAPTGTAIGRAAVADTMVGDEKLARIAIECRERHPGRREEVLASEDEAPRREWVQAAGEPGEDALLHLVERLVGHLLLELAVHDADVHAELIRAVRAPVWGKIAHRGSLGHDVWDLHPEVLTKEPEQ